jgi:hypothetical protein
MIFSYRPRGRAVPHVLAMKGSFALLLSLLAIVSCKTSDQASVVKDDSTEAFDKEFKGVGSYPIWSYDAGPSPQSDRGSKLIDLHANTPYFPGLSRAVYGDQMFRPAFGPIPWRMVQEKNKIQILFIGQDGTHIAEAAGRPATAGFGGRAQDLAAYFGVNSSAAFINTYAFTIKWQYGAFDTPVVKNINGKDRLDFASFTGNPVWLITQDQDSPVVKWRNDLIEWIIANNADSLKLIVLFGGAARDAAGAFIESRGQKDGDNYWATVSPRFPEKTILDQKIRVPEFGLEGAGSNKQTAVPLTKQGRDMFREFAKIKGMSVNYKDENSVTKIHDAFAAAFNNLSSESQEVKDLMSKLALPEGGIHGSGFLHPAQLGGYDIGRGIRIVNKAMNYDSDWGTLSLKGLKLSNGLTLQNDLLVTQLPHPTALSMMTDNAAADAVAKGLKGFDKYVNTGWKIEEEKSGGYKNTFHAWVNETNPTEKEKLRYEYRRGDMGLEYYDFGAPNSRMVNVSSASRSGADTIVFGTRDQVSFDTTTLKRMAAAQPSEFPPAEEMWISRAASGTRKLVFDPGPGRDLAKLMKTTLPRDPAFTKKFEVSGDFGHYRGTFKDPKVVVIADPAGEDDLITSRALTGSRGQYLHTLMKSLGVEDQYLVIKTAPFSNYSDADPNSPGTQSWKQIIDATKTYREELLKKVFSTTSSSLILVDGPWAQAEFKRLFPSCPLAVQGACPIVEINRRGPEPESGISDAVAGIKAISSFSNADFNGKMTDIPRSHLTYYARVWEGTSGDRVITSNDPKYVGRAWAQVAPRWAYNQKFKMTSSDMEGCVKLIQKQVDQKTRLGEEKIPKFYTRVASGQPYDADAHCRRVASGAMNGLEGSTAGSDNGDEVFKDLPKDHTIDPSEMNLWDK